MACTACLFASLVLLMAAAKKEEEASSASSGHITNLKQSIFWLLISMSSSQITKLEQSAFLRYLWYSPRPMINWKRLERSQTCLQSINDFLQKILLKDLFVVFGKKVSNFGSKGSKLWTFVGLQKIVKGSRNFITWKVFENLLIETAPLSSLMSDSVTWLGENVPFGYFLLGHF